MRKLPMFLFLLVIILGILYINNVMFESPKIEENIERSYSSIELLDVLKI